MNAKTKPHAAKSDPLPTRIPGGVCKCGHIGGNNSYTQHAARFDLGHGNCMAKRCRCAQFTWTRNIERADLPRVEAK